MIADVGVVHIATIVKEHKTAFFEFLAEAFYIQMVIWALVTFSPTINTVIATIMQEVVGVGYEGEHLASH